MNPTDDAEQDRELLAFAYELDAAPAKVWRALTVPDYVARWLAPPERAGEAPAPASLRLIDCEPNQCVRYALREAASPFAESTVTFRIAANEAGGTTFRIVHELKTVKPPRAANANRARLLLAA